MLKNREIIDKLNIEQKLSLLAGQAMAGPEAMENAVPVIDVTSLHDINNAAGADVYPSFNSIASSWNVELIRNIAAQLAKRAKGDNPAAIITPDLGIKMHAYKNGMSEDPYLSGKLAAAYAGGIADAGAMPILADLSVSGHDADFMDLDVNKYIIRDYVAKPFEISLKECGAGAVMTSGAELKGNYRDVNSKLINEILRGKPFNAHAVCSAAADGAAAIRINAGNILLNGNSHKLMEAHSNYLRMEEAYKSGTVTAKELETACENGTEPLAAKR